MANYGWQKLKGTEQDVRWRDLHVRRHWAETYPDGSWAIYEGQGKKKSVKVAKGFEGTREVAERAVREWEQRKMREVTGQ